ncbi:MAG: YcbK family protein [Rhizobiaceae bacterium]
MTNPSFAAAGAAAAAGEGAAAPAPNGEIPENLSASADLSAPGTATAILTVMDPSDSPLPETVAYAPTPSPTGGLAEFPAVPATADAGGATQAVAAEAAGSTPVPPTAAADQSTGSTGQIVASAAPAAADSEFILTAAPAPAAAAPPKKRGFLSNLFASSAQAAPMKPAARAAVTPVVEEKPVEPLVQLASVDPDEAGAVRAAAFAGGDNALPGVRKTALFEIRRKSGIDDDSDVDLHEDEEDFGGSYKVASAAGLARLAPNGLLTQTENVDVACLKPSLVRVLKAVESHYGRKMSVTSGYRDQQRNRRARGAKNSLHMYCAAADVQVPGVSKWELAAFVRSMPGRGGVGTYCHTESVHIDVGPERDWNWRCRGKRKKRH